MTDLINNSNSGGDNCPHAKYAEDLKHQLQKLSELNRMYMDIKSLNELQLRKDELQLENLKEKIAVYQKQIQVLLKEIALTEFKIKKAEATNQAENESQQLMIRKFEEILNFTKSGETHIEDPVILHN